MIDEFHEPFTLTDGKTKKKKYGGVANLIKHFTAENKWCLTGTPFDKGTECLNHMFNYCTDYKNNIQEKIYEITDINNFMNTRFFKRSTKKSTADENKLKKLTEKNYWLHPSKEERMIYSAYLANPNVDKFSKLMRQLCCHPQIAEETKALLGNCKTLKDIEQTMVGHYKKQYELAKTHVVKKEASIVRLEKRKLVLTFRRQKRFLKKLDYKVKLEYPDWCEISDEEDEDEKDGDGQGNVVKLTDYLDEDDEDDSDDDDDREEITVTANNQDAIMKLVRTQWMKTPSAGLLQIDEALTNARTDLAKKKNDLSGKEITYNFFTNVLDRAKKTAGDEEDKDDDDSNSNDIAGASDNDSDDSDDSDNDSDSDSDSDSSDCSSDSDDDDDDKERCGICLEAVDSKDVGVTKCGHIYDYQCIKSMLKTTPKCPVCNTRLKENEVFLISYEKKEKKPTGLVKDKLDMINRIGTKLTNLIYYLTEIDDHVIIFSQWTDLLLKVGQVLDEYNIENRFCRGHVWQRDKAIREFNESDDIKVIMLSSESAASGTNLTLALTM